LVPLLRKTENIAGGGSIASTLGRGNTSFVTGWPIRRPIAKREDDWSTGLPKCITSETGAGIVENQNGSDLIPRDEPVLACFRTQENDNIERLKSDQGRANSC
jgi:hypothetical protein